VTNLFPAILFCGPPHSGKSVLTHHLTQCLRKRKISHYLLRAVPDGEGNWFLDGDLISLIKLRLRAKRSYTSRFVTHMRSVIENRLLPLLVDVGGRPQGDEQFALLAACTHAVLLYRTEEERQMWRGWLDPLNLQIVAELRSDLNGEDTIQAEKPFLQGTIAGLDRESDHRRFGVTCDCLVDQVAGICSYSEIYLEGVHVSQAPLTPLIERSLRTQLPPPQEGDWLPEHLAAAVQLLSPGQPCAIYGRGPAWLAACLAIHALPASAAIFDVSYGWISVPRVRISSHPKLSPTLFQLDDFDVLDVPLPSDGILEPVGLAFTRGPGERGLILNGKLPRWAFAALARYFAHQRAWLALYEPKKRAVVVCSQSSSPLVGDIIPVDLSWINPAAQTTA